jgi:hypothetical protein
MQLTADQKQALERGEAVSLILENTPCVVIRRDIYERIRPLVDGGQEIDVTALYPLVNQALREDDAHDPWLDSYQDYRP